MVLPLLWALLAALALALSWTTRAPAFAWVGYLMLAIWFLGLVVARLSERGLTASRQLSADRVPFGGEVTVEVKVSNRSSLPVLWLAASEALPAGLPMTGVRGRLGPLRGRGEFRFRYALHGARRGYYQLGPTLLRTGDLFGLIQRERAGVEAAPLTVFPRIVAIRQARTPSRRPAGETRARQRVLEDPTQVVGIRPYQHGDSLRRVHWRATAHTGRLQSKLFEVSAQVLTTLVLNLRRSDYPDSPAEAEEEAELAIVAAASIARHVLSHRQRIGLLALGRDPAQEKPEGTIRVRGGRGREQLAAILSALGRIELGASPELAEVLRREKENLPWGSLVIVITPHTRGGPPARPRPAGADEASALTEESLSVILGLRKAGFQTSVILIGRTGDPVSPASPVATFAAYAARVSSEADIRGLDL